MAIGDRYELLDGMKYLAQDCLNVYFYKFVGGPSGSAGDLVTVWTAAVLPTVVAMQQTGVVHQLIAARNLDNPLDFFAFPPLAGNVGQITGQGMPPFVAWAFRLLRTRTDVHHGAKRIVGVPEGLVADGVADAGAAAVLANYASIYGADLVTGAGNQYEPVIMRRVLDAAGHLIGYDDFPAGLAQYVRISSQNTRKFGRGV